MKLSGNRCGAFLSRTLEIVGAAGVLCFAAEGALAQTAAQRAPAEAARPATDSKSAAKVAPAAAPGSAATASAASGAPAQRPLERGDLEAFFDGAIRTQLESKHIAGAVVSVVVGDKPIFSKGYGYADVETHRPVDPATTQFRIASISKLFTWTAVMQLVEQGKLDLDADVNKYLKDFQIPATFDKPVTLKSLLTHTPGFEDNAIGLFGRRSDVVGPLGEVLKRTLPTRVRPPGEICAYSNYGTALAGLVVASVRGKPWEDSIEETIINPLGLKYTLVRQPPKDKLPATLSKGYKWEGGRFKDFGFEYVPQAPAGTIAASAGDIARFMIAHLNDGACEGARILQSETARRMREPLFRHDPKVDAMCYGFWEKHQNGQTLVQHGGDTIVFHSLLALIPASRVGLFVSYNTNTAGGAREELWNAFLDRYFPSADPPRPKADAGFATTGKRFEGEYASTRASDTTYAKLGQLIQGLRAKVNDDGTLTLQTAAGARRFVEVEPLVFQELDGKRKLVFRADDRGTVTHLFPADAPAVAFARESWFQTSVFQWSLLGATSALFVSAVFFWPVIAFCVRGLHAPSIRRTGLSALATFVAWLLSAACLAVVAGLLIGLSEPDELAFGTPPLLKWVLVVPQVCAALAAVAFLLSIVAWAKGYWRFSGRVHYTLVALAGVGFCWFTYSWNLLQFTKWPIAGGG